MQIYILFTIRHFRNDDFFKDNILFRYHMQFLITKNKEAVALRDIDMIQQVKTDFLS